MAFKYKQQVVRLAYTLIDFLCICFSIFIACKIRQTTLPFEVTISNIFLDQANPFRFLFVFWIVTAILFLGSKALYQTRREVLEGFEISLILKSVVFSTLVVIVAIYALKIEGFPRTVLFVGSAFIAVTLSIWRVIKRVLVEYMVSRGYNNFNAVIIGAGKVGTMLADEIKNRPGLGINIVGFIDDFKENDPEENGPHILGTSADFVKIARREFISKIYIATHSEGKVFLKLLKQANDMGIAVRVVPQGFELMSGEFFKYNIGIVPILEYSSGERFHKQFGKRLFDFILAAVLLLLLSPVFICLAIMIKMDTPGPVFYFSKRFGRGGNKFNMFKFRSMVMDADAKLGDYLDQNEVDGPIFKMKKDPRITKLGAALRRYSLDELPQIINVIKGDMSLVGPRPLPIEQIRKEDLRQLMRLEVRPGITGLWQIRGRSDISFARLVKWDMWYINNWSFWLDFNILLQTIPVVLKGKGAY